MGSITTGTGLISGINTASLIDQLIALEAQGKLPLQKRIASLTTARTALLDINARLLNLQTSSAKFRLNKIFQSSLAKSSDESLLTAVAGTSTPSGTYQFIVKQLSSTSQLRSKGFATSQFTPLGLDSLSFEFGDVGLRRDTDLSTLNGGDGVRRGKITITDKLAQSATVDLSTATTLEDVVARINAAEGISVSAAIQGERLVIQDESSGGGVLTISNVPGSFTASDLGIVGTTAGGSIVSTQLGRLGTGTSLQSLNSGNGVLIRDDSVDFRLQVGASTFDISLGRVDAPITVDTELAKLNNGTGVRINTTDQPDFVVRSTDGTLVDINLGEVLDEEGEVDDEAVSTVGELLNRVNQTLDAKLGAGTVVMSIRADGQGFVLTDNTVGGADPLRVVGAGPFGDETAQDLGIWTGSSGGSGPVITGLAVPNEVAIPRAATIQDVIDRIQEQTGNAVSVAVNSAGTGLLLDAGGATISVLAGSVDGSSFGTAISERTARDLGIWGLSGPTIDGDRIQSGLGTLLARDINGGGGLGGADTLTITDRLGHSTVVNGLAALTTLEEVVDAINGAASANGVLASVSFGADNRSLEVHDSSGGLGTLSLSGAAATALGIDKSASAATLFGDDLEVRDVSEAQSLSSLNYGRGIGSGKFKITDSSGDSAVVDVGGDSTTLYDVIHEINSRGLLVEARVNDTGDGIVLVDTNPSPATVKMKVQDTSGTVASSLGIAGTANDFGEDIVGSFERTVDLDPTDSLSSVISKINAAGVGVTAAVVNSGSGPAPFYLSLASTISGRNGRLLTHTGGVDLGLTTVSEGRDAELFFGSTDPTQALLLRSSTNTFENVVSGLAVTAVAASSNPVTVQVERDITTIKDTIKEFVAAFNDVIGRIDDYDSYDQETEKRGALLGDPTVARARQLLYSTVQGRAKNVDGPYQFLSQIGIRTGKDGLLTFDEATYDEAYATNPGAVEKLFVTFKQETVSSIETPIPGVTIGSPKIVSTALGFGDLFSELAKSLTNSVDGVFTKASQQFQSLIDRTNERIDLFDERLEARRSRLESQFAAMEAALSRLQAQQGALNSLLLRMQQQSG